MTQVRIGLVGAGFLARTRARCYARVHGAGATVTAVASSDGAAARAFVDEHGVGAACASAAELFARDDVDVVDLCVPNHLHRPLTVDAAAAGKHVVCTKPMAAYVGQDLDDASDAARTERRAMYRVAVDDARAMVDATDAAGVRLVYGENWVYAPPITRAAGLLAQGDGVLLEMRGWEAHSGSHSPFSRRWQHAGGGALIRLAAHPIGAMLHLKRAEGLRRAGAPVVPTTVLADVTDLTARDDLTEANTSIATGWDEVENWGQVVIGFSDGSRGVAHGSDAQLGGMQSQLHLASSDGHVVCSLSPHDLVRSYAARDGAFGDSYVMEKASTQAGWNTPLPDEDWSSGHQGLCQDVVDCIAADRAPASDGTLGLDVTRLVYAAYVSAAEGKRIDLAELSGP